MPTVIASPQTSRFGGAWTSTAACAGAASASVARIAIGTVLRTVARIRAES
jgi:hypothetical protein